MLEIGLNKQCLKNGACASVSNVEEIGFNVNA